MKISTFSFCHISLYHAALTTSFQFSQKTPFMNPFNFKRQCDVTSTTEITIIFEKVILVVSLNSEAGSKFFTITLTNSYLGILCSKPLAVPWLIQHVILFNSKIEKCIFLPFSTNVPLLYSLKKLENLQFSDVFRGHRKGTLFKNGLTMPF